MPSNQAHHDDRRPSLLITTRRTPRRPVPDNHHLLRAQGVRMRSSSIGTSRFINSIAAVAVGHAGKGTRVPNWDKRELFAQELVVVSFLPDLEGPGVLSWLPALPLAQCFWRPFQLAPDCPYRKQAARTRGKHANGGSWRDRAEQRTFCELAS